MTCETCKLAFDLTVNCSFNISQELDGYKSVREQLKQTIYYKIKPEFLQTLNDKIDCLVECLHEELTDEQACGCLGKYPS